MLILRATVPGGCPSCQSKKAYFFQLQTRSADEPPTSFYKVRLAALFQHTQCILTSVCSASHATSNGENTKLISESCELLLRSVSTKELRSNLYSFTTAFSSIPVIHLPAQTSTSRPNHVVVTNKVLRTDGMGYPKNVGDTRNRLVRFLSSWSIRSTVMIFSTT